MDSDIMYLHWGLEELHCLVDPGHPNFGTVTIIYYIVKSYTEEEGLLYEHPL